MAKTRRSYTGGAVSTTTSASIAASGTTSFTVADATGWPYGSAPFFVVIEPGSASEEKILVTRSGSTDTTISVYATPTVAANRGLDGTVAVSHSSGSAVYPVFTATDADEANEMASTLTSKGDLLTHGASTFGRLAVGTNNYALVADSAQTLGIKWGQIQTAGIADDAVTAAKIASGAVGNTEIAAGAITADKFASGAVPDAVPPGVVSPYAGSSAPSGWLLCDGSTKSQTTYAALYAVIGATYNTGSEGAGNFRLPNMKGKVPVGLDSAQTEFDVLGETGGAKTVTLTAAESGLPAHSHDNTASASTAAAHTHSIDHSHTASSNTVGDHAHGVNARPDDATSTGSYFISAEQTTQVVQVADTAGAGSHSHTITIPAYTGSSGSAGSHTHTITMTNASVAAASASSAHQNMPPYLVLNYIIKT